MKRFMFPAALAAVASLVLVGCDADTTGASSNLDAAEYAQEQPDQEVAFEDSEKASEQVKLTVEESERFGEYLADQNGRALYLLEGEPKDVSTCYGECAAAWPPLIAKQGEPKAGSPAVKGELISTFQRADGSRQVSYNGHALYYYVEDRGLGEATGQEVTDDWGEWYLLTPAGEPLETHEHEEEEEGY